MSMIHGQKFDTATNRHHLKQDRCCTSFGETLKGVFYYTTLPAAPLFRYARKFVLIGYGETISRKVVHAIATFFCRCKKWEWEEKRRKIEKINFLRNKFGMESHAPDFCKDTARLIYETIPLAISEQCDALPAHLETWLFYQAGLTIRYINYQIDKHTDYRNMVITSVVTKKLQGNFQGACIHASQFLLDRESLENLVNLEEVLLEICLKMTSQKECQETKKWLKVIFSSLGISFSQEEEIENYLKQPQFQSNDQKLIGRLSWLKKRNLLPKGLPDPSLVRLTEKNLRQELDRALKKRLIDLVQSFLNKHSPTSLQTGVLGVVYKLEGKDGLIQALSHVISEFGIKQITDPHLFAIAILYSSGEEVADYELDGFGRNKRGEILSLGKEIMEKAKKSSWSEVVHLVQGTDLKVAQGGEEEILQRFEVRKQLTSFIENIIYDMIKGDHSQNASILKDVRERATKLPIVGIATICLHSLINGVFYSFEYLIREKESTNSFLSWMFQRFSGKQLCHYLAKRIVALVYHPCWHVTIMQTIDLIIDSQNKSLSSEITSAEVRPITEFLFQHFLPKSEFPFKQNFMPLVGEVTAKTLVEQITMYVSPKEQNLFEKSLSSLIPTMKESTLYFRLLNSFRKQKIRFEGDQKFWEVFVREVLNQLVADALQEGAKTGVTKATLREERVDQLLSYDENQLRSYLLSLGERSFFAQDWDMLNETNETAISDGSLTEYIEWAYEKKDEH